MKQFNVGVIGIGDISNVYINNLMKYDLIKVLACAGRNLEKARQKAIQHGIPKAYATPQELIDDSEIDIVLNLTTPQAHAEINLAALRAGKHVYTEKPLAATLEDGQKILRLAKEKGLYVGCAPDTFLGGRLQTCRKLIDDGTIGDVFAASAFVVSHGHEWHHPNPDFFYQPGAGPLLDIGPYYMTALLSLLGPVKRCSAMSTRAFGERTIEWGPRIGETMPVSVDTHITGNLEFANGAIATLIASFDIWDSELPRMEIYGTKGTICINDIDPIDGPNLFGGEILLRTRENYRWKGLPRPATYPDWAKVPVGHQFNSTSHAENSRGIGLIDMVYAIKNGREERASGKMAFHSLEAMLGMLQSAEDGCFYQMTSTFNRPEPMTVDFPQSGV